MIETMAYGYSPESTQWGLSNKYQHGGGLDVFQKSLRLCVLNESSLSIGRTNEVKQCTAEKNYRLLVKFTGNFLTCLGSKQVAFDTLAIEAGHVVDIIGLTLSHMGLHMV